MPGYDLGIVPVANPQFIYDFADKFPNVTAWGVSFTPQAKLRDSKVPEYQLWYNYTNSARKNRVRGAPSFIFDNIEPYNDETLAMVRELDEAIMQVMGYPDASLNVQLKDLPSLPEGLYRCPADPDSVFKNLGPVFMFVPLVFIFFPLISSIVGEKEKQLKDALEMMGLHPVAYWFGHLITAILMCALCSFTLVAMGALLGFNLFSNGDPTVLFMVFFVTGCAWLGLAVLLASLTTKVKAGIGAGFFFVIIGASSFHVIRLFRF